MIPNFFTKGRERRKRGGIIPQYRSKKQKKAAQRGGLFHINTAESIVTGLRCVSTLYQCGIFGYRSDPTTQETVMAAMETQWLFSIPRPQCPFKSV